MKRILLAAAAGLILPSLAWATDARLVYKDGTGTWVDAAVASLTCGVDSSGIPQLCLTGDDSSDSVALRMGVEAATSSTDARIVYQTLTGGWAEAIPTVPVCSVDSEGVPQICDISTPDLSGYLTTTLAASTYAKLAVQNSFTGEQQFANAYFADPDQGVSRDAKFGDRGIAVKGGTKTDTLSVTTSAYVPDTTTSDSTTAALNTESAAARFVSSTTAASTYETIAGMSSYLLATKPSIDGGTLTTDGKGDWILSGNNGILFGGKEWLNYNAANGYIGVNGNLELTGRLTLPTRTTGDNGNYAATTAFVQNTISALQGYVTGDLSASGSSLTLPVGSSGLNLVMSYSASGQGALTAVSASGSLTPVDIYEVASWDTTSFKGYTLDSGTITTTATTVDGTFYLTSNAVGTYHIGVGGHLYIVDIFGSGAGKRTFMSWRMIY